MVKRILIGLGGTPFGLAKIRLALDLAQRHGAELTGVTIFDAERLSNVGAVPIGGGAAAHDLREHREREVHARMAEAIEQFGAHCREAGVRHRVVTESGEPFSELVSLSRYHDLTILAVRALFEQGVVDEPEDEVIRVVSKGVRPLIAVGTEFRPIGRVLIAYNGTPHAAKALKHYVQMNLWNSPEVKIVCSEKDEGEARMFLLDARSYCAAHGIDAETEWDREDPREHLLRVVQEWNADLVVMGAAVHSGLHRLIFGDTVLSMLRGAATNLFLSQ